jgi:hypothetical protein
VSAPNAGADRLRHAPGRIAASWRSRRFTVLGIDVAWISMAATIVFVGVFAVGQVMGLADRPIDFVYVWEATNFDDLYGEVWGEDAWFVYPPPIAQAFVLVRPLGLDVATVLWELVLAGCLVYIVRGWALPLVGLALLYLATGLPVLEPFAQPLGQVLTGNVQMLLLAALVAGFRYPALWAFPILTKVSPAVALLWFPARGEWRSFAIALGTTGAIVAVSFALAPAGWFEWVEFTIRTAGAAPPVPVLPIPPWFGIPAAIVLVVWAARGNRRWAVPLALILASPSPYIGYWATLAMTSAALWWDGVGAPREDDGPGQVRVQMGS